MYNMLLNTFCLKNKITIAIVIVNVMVLYNSCYCCMSYSLSLIANNSGSNSIVSITLNTVKIAGKSSFIGNSGSVLRVS